MRPSLLERIAASRPARWLAELVARFGQWRAGR